MVAATAGAIALGLLASPVAHAGDRFRTPEARAAWFALQDLADQAGETKVCMIASLAPGVDRKASDALEGAYKGMRIKIQRDVKSFLSKYQKEDSAPDELEYDLWMMIITTENHAADLKVAKRPLDCPTLKKK